MFEFLQALFNYVMIVAVCTWYFSSSNDTSGNFSLWTGFKWSLTYNLGSLALGSLVLAIIWIFRVIFEYIDNKLSGAKEQSSVIQYVSMCCRCFLDCFHRFIKFLNTNAYIQIALTGENFCPSAMNAFVLALKHTGSFLITNGIGGLLSLLGKAAITIGNIFLAFFMLRFFPEFKALSSPIGPLVTVGLMSFMLASIFMEVYGTVSLTIL